jgi:hypothetical protein
VALEPIYQIDVVRDLPLAKAYRESPSGPHSPDTLRLLNRLRWEPMDDKHVLVCLERHQRWVIGKLGVGRGAPVQLIEDRVFSSREEAEWTVFKWRWKNLTGEELPLP